VHDKFYSSILSSDYTINDFLNDEEVSNVIKILIRSTISNPLIPNDDSYEAESFIMSKFKTKDSNNELVEPEGLAVAYIREAPVVSFPFNEYWQRTPLKLTVFEAEFEKEVDITNVYSEESIEIFEQLNEEQIELNSEANIYLVFPKEQYRFEQKAIDDIISWYYDDSRYLIRITQLISDIEHNPFTGGIGKTKVLLGESGKASKRIVKKDRLIYTYTKELITIHSCRERY
jgi:Txe/YoeB family toxin of toxin-antitoxin system